MLFQLTYLPHVPTSHTLPIQNVPYWPVNFLSNFVKFHYLKQKQKFQIAVAGVYTFI